MAKYATESEFLQTSLPAEAFSTLPVGAIDQALIWASSRANSKIKKRYTLPLLAYGEDLKRAVCSLAAWELMAFRGFKPGSGASEAIIMRKDDALAWLEDIATGAAELDNVTDSSPILDEAGPLVSSDPVPDWDYFTSSDPSCP